MEVVRSPKSFSDFASRSDFSFAIIDKISATSSFFDWIKIAKSSELCEKLNGLIFARLISLGKYKCKNKLCKLLYICEQK